jgi:hypothetical protein
MYRYFDSSDDSFLKNDEIYQKIINKLDPIVSNLNSEGDKQLMLKMISDSYHKYHNSIRAKSQSDTELMMSTIMSLLIEQSNELERLRGTDRQ